MSKNRLYQFTGILLSCLLLAPLFTSLAGCSGQLSWQVESDDSAPFYTDRVVAVRIVMAADDWEFTQKNARAEEYVKADIWYDGELVPDVAVRPKGNSSLMSVAQSGTSRMSLKVDFNFFNSERTFYGLKKVNFNNGFSDPTLIREFLSYDLFRQMGMPTPRASFVDLWVNDTHLGLYTMVEQIDKTFLSNNFADSTGNLYKPESPAAYLNWTEEDIDSLEAVSSADEVSEAGVNIGGGNLVQIMQALAPKSNTGEAGTSPHIAQNMVPPQGLFPGEGMQPTEGMGPPPEGFPSEGMQLPEGMTPLQGIPPREGMQPPGGMAPGMPGNRSGNLLKQMGLKTNENKPDHSALLSLLDVLNKEPDETFQEEIEKVLDVDQVLRYLAVSTVLVHLDNYTGQFGHNYYLYEVDGKFTIITWDLNMTFGGFNSGIDRQRIINFYIDEPTAGPVADRPLVARLLAVHSYMETYHGYLEELINGSFSIGSMEAKIDRLASLIRPYVEADTLKFYSTAEFEKGLGEDVATSTRMSGMGLNIGLKAFVTQRVESIRQQLEGTLPSKSSDGTGNGGNQGGGGFPGNQGNRPGLPRNPGGQQPVFPVATPDAGQINQETVTGGNQ